MAARKRYLEDAILSDALETGKMAFISGPRQCGKTTLAERLLQATGCQENYFNWDDEDFRRQWLRSPKGLAEQLRVPEAGLPLMAFDELHKHRHWKNSLKGFYDLNRKRVRILVTGSARLDVYRKSGDSLVGRYLPYRLHPFTLGETAQVKPPPAGEWPRPSASDFKVEDLLELGGFAEPLFSASKQKAERWWRIYRDQLIREDLRDLKAVRDLNLVSALVTLLADKVSGPLSYASLQEDLKVAFATARDWVEALESLYFCFLVRPYSRKIAGSLRKEPKLYFYHWAAVKDPGKKLENMVACHLLKSCHAWTDLAFGDFRLWYLRDKHKREVDFLVTRDERPWLLVEVKSSDRELSPTLAHFTELLRPELSVQVGGPGPKQKRAQLLAHGRVQRLDAETFLSALN